ncbi:uncharacterized protein LOC131154834 [Malania oleifera]|uniref:uncharacterized protein LOC131154834 n=1 Tax=Malania oleifera TaxID=397392 RepID=UPI0025AE2BAA|nr:uncharacterized protein LOC131154834 [Malania oleifera]
MANPVDEVGLGYWLRWQVPVCALIFVVPAAVALILVIRRIKSEPPTMSSADDLWRSCWRNLNPLWLLFYRAFAFLFMAFLLFRVVARSGAFVFYFYTQWTFALVMIYFALGTIISAYGCWICSKKPTSKNKERDELLKRDLQEDRLTNAATSKSKADTGNAKLQSYYSQQEALQKSGYWGYLMRTIYHTCAGASILTDIVFWCVLVPLLSNKTFKLDLLMGCMHVLNAFFLLLDTSINSLPFSLFGIVYFVLWSCSYIIFQWTLHACGFTWWPYPFLELSTPWAPLWYFCLALVHIPCYGIYALLVKAKISIFPRLFPHAFVKH